MGILNKTKIIQKTAILSLFIFLFTYIGVFSMSMNMSSDMHERCSFMVGTSICSMTAVDHASIATTIFTAVTSNRNFLIYIFSCFRIYIFIHLFSQVFSPPKFGIKPFNFSSYTPLHSFLQEEFSSGILNPKTF